MTIRQQLVECMEFAEEVERMGDEMAQRQQQIIQMQVEENKCEGRKDFFRKLFLIPMGIAALFTIVGIVMYGLEEMMQMVSFIRKMLVMESAVALYGWLVIAVIMCGFLFWVLSARKLRRMREENKMKRQQLEESIQQLRGRAQDLVDCGYKKGYYEIVPMDYFGSEMLEYCISVIDRKLATTLQEAFLLLERELQRQEERMQQQMWHDAQAEQMEQLTNAVNRNTMVTLLVEQERRNNYR